MRSAAIGLIVLGLGLWPGSSAAGTGPAVPCPIYRATCDPPSLESIQMIDTLRGWAVTHGQDPNALLRTTDGGRRWTVVTPPSTPDVRQRITAFHALTAQIAWVAWSSPDLPPHGGVGSFYTADGGRTWRAGVVPSDDQNPVLALESIRFINPREGWLLGQGSGAMGRWEAFVYRSTDGGATWIEIAAAGYMRGDSGLPFAGSKAGIAFVNPTTGWVTGGHSYELPWLLLYMTRDGGRTWREQDLALPPGAGDQWSAWTQQPEFFTPRSGVLAVLFQLESEPGLVFVAYVTRDGGATWTRATPLPLPRWPGALWGGAGYAFVDPNNGWVSDGESLSVTRDGGRTWATRRPGGAFVDIKQIEFVSPRQGWAVSRLWPYLLRTADGGRTWTPLLYEVSGP